MRLGSLGLVTSLVLGGGACTAAGDGVSPPHDRLYFPVGLTVDATSDWLYVVNSDFDLQFNRGTVQSLRLERVRELTPRVCGTDDDCAAGELCDVGSDELGPTADNGGVASYFCVPDRQARPCGSIPESTPSSRALAPGRCAPMDLTAPPDGGESFLEESVAISAFATDSLIARRPVEEADVPPGAPARLFIPVRSDRSLHYIDVDGGHLECGQPRDRGNCSDAYRVGRNTDLQEELDLPTEPFGIAATADGRVLMMTHQVGGRVSAFLNDWDGPPSLEVVRSGLPQRPIGIAVLPPRPLPAGPTQALAYEAGFLVAFRNAPQVNLLRFLAEDSNLLAPTVVNAGQVPITINTLGVDSRGIAVDDPRPEARARCEELPVDERAACLEAAEGEPLAVYVANRTPPSLLVGRTQPVMAPTQTGDLPAFYANIPLTAGPSRVVLGNVLTDDGSPEGRLERRVFVLCFDSNVIYVYDPVRQRLETEVFTGRGPHSLAFDGKRPVAYVGHFTDSYIGVVSLDQRSPWNYGAMIASIGTPRPPRASK